MIQTNRKKVHIVQIKVIIGLWISGVNSRHPKNSFYKNKVLKILYCEVFFCVTVPKWRICWGELDSIIQNMEQKDDKQACYECKLNTFILKWKPKKKKSTYRIIYWRTKLKISFLRLFMPSFANTRSKLVNYVKYRNMNIIQ